MSPSDISSMREVTDLIEALRKSGGNPERRDELFREIAIRTAVGSDVKGRLETIRSLILNRDGPFADSDLISSKHLDDLKPSFLSMSREKNIEEATLKYLKALQSEYRTFIETDTAAKSTVEWIEANPAGTSADEWLKMLHLRH